MHFESIHNYYEALVEEHIKNTLGREPDADQSFLEDVACLALNQLPPRYVRHDEDMAFFLTIREREKMQKRVTEAVLEAARRARENNAKHRQH